MGDARHLLAVSDMPPAIDENADLRSYSAWNSIMAALETLVATFRTDRTILAANLCGSLSHDVVW